MTEGDFWDSTPRSFTNRAKGFYELEERKERNMWERARWLGSIILQPYSKKGQTIKPRDLFLFSDEKELSKIPDMSDDKTRDIYRKLIERQGLNMPEMLK